MSNQEGLVRYKGSDRLNHWLIALLFVLAALRGGLDQGAASVYRFSYVCVVCDDFFQVLASQHPDGQ